MAERQVFQLPLQLPDAQPVGQRRVDVAGQLGQCPALLIVQLVGRAHARQLPGQQDRHHAQVADDGQQQAAQAFAVAPRFPAGMQGPDRVGRILAVQQPGHGRCMVAQRQCVQMVAQGRQIEQQRGQHHALIRSEHGQRIQGVTQHRPVRAHGRLCVRAPPSLAQGLAQRGRQHRCRRSVQQGIQAGDGSAVHSIERWTMRPLH